MSDYIINGKTYVVGDNIDADQIIPAQYLNLVPTIPEEYKKLGSHAMSGLPEDLYPMPFIKPGESTTEYPILIAGSNFGCSSSREHSPICLSASGVKIIIAESFGRIFFRNCVTIGKIYPVESKLSIINYFKIGDETEVCLDRLVVRNLTTGEFFKLKFLGDVRNVINEGGLFNYARKNGMIKT